MRNSDIESITTRAGAASRTASVIAAMVWPSSTSDGNRTLCWRPGSTSEGTTSRSTTPSSDQRWLNAVARSSSTVSDSETYRHFSPFSAPSIRKRRPSVVLPEPGRPSIRWMRCLGNPPRRTMSSSGMPVWIFSRSLMFFFLESYNTFNIILTLLNV
ncbi:hypothetical protein MASSI9I_10219 [Massilia sp. 9I]|nr:hypothetical protein MASSI9I_10219 [Massilia sp. 9I]